MHINVLETRPAAEFGGYRPPAITGDDSLQGRMLIRVSGAGRLEDHFHLAVGGVNQIAATFAGSDISDHPALINYTFRLEIDPGEITFKANSFSTKWEDLEPIIAADRIHVSSEEAADAGAQFRTGWDAAKKTAAPPAAALRWSIQANTTYGFKLALLALPATARALRKDARLNKDTTKAVELASWIAASTLATEGSWTGPLPILFTPDAAATRASLSAHPERLTTGKNSLNYEINLRKLIFQTTMYL